MRQSEEPVQSGSIRHLFQFTMDYPVLILAIGVGAGILFSFALDFLIKKIKAKRT